jgi:uncharacterized membrane protein
MKLKIFLLMISLTFVAGTGTLRANENGLSFKENLFCIFTEPFYSVDIKNGELFFRDMSEKTIPFIVTKIQQSLNHSNIWVLNAKSGKDGNVTMFIQETNSCSDDMSDFTYKYNIVFHSESKNITLSGCGNRNDNAGM